MGYSVSKVNRSKRSVANIVEHWRILWHHDDPACPVEVFSELGNDGYETRKVHIFRDGRHDYADETRWTKDTELGDQRVEEEDKESTPELEMMRVSSEQFNTAWCRAREWSQ